MEEIWKAIPDFEGLYEVSTHGKIRSLPRISSFGCAKKKFTGRILSTSIKTKGAKKYKNVVLSNGKIRQTNYVHYYVALVFLGPRPAGLNICHNDGDCENNSLSNLRYGTQVENRHDLIRHGRDTSGWSKLTRSDMNEIIFLSKTMQKDRIAKKFNITRSIVGAIAAVALWEEMTLRAEYIPDGSLSTLAWG